jgi:hypothetical protein
MIHFRILENKVYALGNDESFVLDTRGYDDPNHWVWFIIGENTRSLVEGRISGLGNCSCGYLCTCSNDFTDGRPECQQCGKLRISSR